MESSSESITTTGPATNTIPQTVNILIQICTYLLLIIGFCGIVGNFLTIRLIFRHARKKGIYLMFLLLAVCDLVYIVFNMIYVGAMNLSGGQINITYLSGCHVVALASFVSSELSSWLLVLITIERVVVCYLPHQSYFSLRRVALYVGCISVGVLLPINFPYFGGLRPELQDSGVLEACQGRNAPIVYYYMVVYRKLEFSVYCLIPAALLVILNIALLRKLRLIKLQVSPTEMNVISNTNSIQLRNLEQGQGQGQGQGQKQGPLPTAVTIKAAHTVKTLLRLSKTTLLLSLTFILCTFPLAMVNLVSYSPAMLAQYGSGIYLALNITFVLSFCNHCMNCVLYCLSGSKYRQQLLKLVTCKKN